MHIKEDIEFRRLYANKVLIRSNIVFFSLQPKKAATMCRAPTGECDLPEFCWGDSQYCPEDVFLEDGVECYNGQVRYYKSSNCQSEL